MSRTIKNALDAILNDDGLTPQQRALIEAAYPTQPKRITLAEAAVPARGEGHPCNICEVPLAPLSGGLGATVNALQQMHPDCKAARDGALAQGATLAPPKPSAVNAVLQGVPTQVSTAQDEAAVIAIYPPPPQPENPEIAALKARLAVLEGTPPLTVVEPTPGTVLVTGLPETPPRKVTVPPAPTPEAPVTLKVVPNGYKTIEKGGALGLPQICRITGGLVPTHIGDAVWNPVWACSPETQEQRRAMAKEIKAGTRADYPITKAQVKLLQAQYARRGATHPQGDGTAKSRPERKSSRPARQPVPHVGTPQPESGPVVVLDAAAKARTALVKALTLAQDDATRNVLIAELAKLA
jgi:hypothetical protein